MPEAAIRAILVTCCLMGFVSFADAATSERVVLRTVGTGGGPVPLARRAQSANLLTVGGVEYLIDAGDGTLRRLAQAGVAYTEIRDVF